MTRPAHRRTARRAVVPAVVLTALAAALGACGGSGDEKAAAPSPAAVAAQAPGSESAPAATQPDAAGKPPAGAVPADPEPKPGSGGASPKAPGYADLVKRQASKPKARFTPCNLVSKAQAEAIIGGPIVTPVEAPQGPTCIYRSTSGRGFVTLAVQRVDFETLRPKLRERRRVDVDGRRAYCGDNGQPVLYVPLAGGRVLSVAAACDVAQRFAVRAAPRVAS